MSDDGQLTGRATLGAACAIFDRELRVLLVRHSYGPLNWELPCGASLPGEDPSSTARRELYEETGLDLLGAGQAATPTAAVTRECLSSN